MIVTLVGMVMLVRLLQFWNAQSPMIVTLFGMVMLVRLLQFRNAPAPMLVTVSGIFILVRLLHPLNAYRLMLVTLPSAGIILLWQPAISVLVEVSIKQFLKAICRCKSKGSNNT